MVVPFVYTEEEMQELRNENKNLKLTLEQMENTCKDYLNDRDTLREENKNLKELNKQMQENYENLNDAYSEILGENEELRKELEWYKKQYEHSIGEDIEAEIEGLINRNIDVVKRLADK